MNEKFVEELGKLGVECIIVNLVKNSIAKCILNKFKYEWYIFKRES